MTPSNDSAPVATARVDRRKIRTRKALIDAAVDLLQSKGYDEVTTDDITDQADVGRRTFYNHFVSKRDCYLAALQSRFAVYAEEIKQSLGLPEAESDSDSQDPGLIVAAMAPRMFRQVALDPVTEQLIDQTSLLSEAVADSQRDHVVENLANGLVSGRFQPALPPESLEPILAAGFIGLVTASIKRKNQQEDSLAWGRFVLQNLGVSEQEAGELLKQAAS